MSPVGTGPSAVPLGPALRRAWLGYQRRLDGELGAAGFGDRGFPDGRVLRLCADPARMTIAQIGRELGITRQGAGKVVASLHDRGYVTVSPSTTNGKEKIVALTPRAVDYLTAQRKAARAIERRLRTELGAERYAVLLHSLEVLGGGVDARMREYLTTMTAAGRRRVNEE